MLCGLLSFHKGNFSGVLTTQLFLNKQQQFVRVVISGCYNAKFSDPID